MVIMIYQKNTSC